VTPTTPCLDGETLAAWVDGGLSRTDAAMAEAHVSSCPRCQEIAGLIVKTTPGPADGASWWRARAPWLIPITAGVAAAGLLMIAPKDPPPSVATPPAASAVESARTAVAPAAPPPAPTVAPQTAQRVAPPAETKPAETKKERQRDERAPAAPGAAGALPSAGALPGTPSAARPSAAAPSAATAPPAVAPERVAADQGARQSFGAVAAKQAVSPDGALHWRITDRGALERSTDAGATWQAVNVGTTATFTTVQAPEPRTALVTTTDGRVFRTTDGGTTWRLQEN